MNAELHRALTCDDKRSLVLPEASLLFHADPLFRPIEMRIDVKVYVERVVVMEVDGIG
jgi:hypothetical protein